MFQSKFRPQKRGNLTLEIRVYVILADVNVKDGEELEKELTANGNQ